MTIPTIPHNAKTKPSRGLLLKNPELELLGVWVELGDATEGVTKAVIVSLTPSEVDINTEAEAEGVTENDCVDEMLEEVSVEMELEWVSIGEDELVDADVEDKDEEVDSTDETLDGGSDVPCFLDKHLRGACGDWCRGRGG